MRAHIKEKSAGYTTSVTRHGKYAQVLGVNRKEEQQLVQAFAFTRQPYPKRS